MLIFTVLKLINFFKNHKYYNKKESRSKASFKALNV
jgi:hypothetical protein